MLESKCYRRRTAFPCLDELQMVVIDCRAYLAVHESLQLELSNAKLAVLFSQTPASLCKVDLCPPHHTHVLRRLPQLQLVCPLQLKILKTSEREISFNLIALSLQYWM